MDANSTAVAIGVCAVAVVVRRRTGSFKLGAVTAFGLGLLLGAMLN